MSTNSRKKSKNKNTGKTNRHTQATNCSFTGKPSYPTKRAAVDAGAAGTRCGRCRQFH